jgi:hypothetical protein
MRDTPVKRKVTPVEDNYYGIGLEGRHMVYAVAVGGDAIVLCDLEAGGFIDADGHVIPE